MKVIRSGKLAGTRFYVKPVVFVTLNVKLLIDKVLRREPNAMLVGPDPVGPARVVVV